MASRGRGSNLLPLILLVGLFSVVASQKVAAQTTCTPSLSGTELITNGSFTGNANSWSPLVIKTTPQPAGWLYFSNNLKHQSADSSVLHGVLSAAPVAGKTYQVSFKVQTMAGGAGTIMPSLGGTAGTAITAMSSSTLTYQQTITVAGTPTTDFSITPSSSFLGYLDDVSVQEVVSFTYPGASAPCYPAAAGAFPAIWPDQNMTSGVINFQTGTPGPFINFMLNQLQHEPHTFLFNDPNAGTSYLYYRPDLRRNNPALAANPYAVLVLKLVDSASATTLGQLSLAKQSVADLAASGFSLNSFVNTPADTSTTAQRHLGYLNIFYKNARNFAGMCGSDPSKCYVACYDPCHNYTKPAGDPSAPNPCVDAATDAKMCPTSPTYDSTFQWTGRQYAPWLSASYFTTLKSLSKIVRTLAYVVGPSTQVNIPSCEDVTVDCDSSKLTQYTQISAKASVSNHQLTSLEWIGNLPQLSDNSIQRNGVTGDPKFLFVLRQSDPLNGGSISVAKGLYPTYPDAAHTAGDYSFAVQSNGDQLLSSAKSYGGYMTNQESYNPDATSAWCAKSSANAGDFAGDACNPAWAWVWDKFPAGEVAAGYPRYLAKYYQRNGSYSTKSPDQPWLVVTNKLGCGGPDPTVGGNCPDKLDQLEWYGYATADRSSYYKTCKEVFTGGIVDGSMINPSTDTLPLIRHGLRTGDKIQVYNPWDSYPIPGLTNYAWYYAIVVDVNNIKLASSPANAQAGVAVNITNNRGCIPWYAWGDTNAYCGTVFVDAYDPIWGNTENRLVKRVEFYNNAGAVTESYDYIHEFDAPAQRCWNGSYTTTVPAH